MLFRVLAVKMLFLAFGLGFRPPCYSVAMFRRRVKRIKLRRHIAGLYSPRAKHLPKSFTFHSKFFYIWRVTFYIIKIMLLVEVYTLPMP